MQINVEKIAVSPVHPEQDRGIVRQYPLDAAAWLWHPDDTQRDPVAVRFRCVFEWEESAFLEFDISADQRFRLRLNGEHVGIGPDRSDLDHWSFHRYRVGLEAGRQELEADVWWLGDLAPAAQTSEAAGFALSAVSPQFHERLTTGVADWQVRRLSHWAFESKPMADTYHVIGPQQKIDGRRADADPWVEPSVVVPALQGNVHGIIRPGRRLYPSPLPEMAYEPRPLGEVRAAEQPGAAVTMESQELSPVSDASLRGAAVDAWRALIQRGEPIEIAAGTSLWAIVELPDGHYDCGFSEVELSGDGFVSFDWAESLFEAESPLTQKGRRSDVAGKVFRGFGDTYHAGADRQRLTGHWWRSGRFVRLWAQAGEQALTLHRVGYVRTGYPLADDSAWSCGDTAFDGALPLAWRGLRACMHETYVDCPYFEQMMYAGDTRVQMLINHVVSADDRLARRGIELFDWSRQKTGFVAERAPSLPVQSSTTFALIWVLMVRDYAWWRDDAAWVKSRMPAVRSQLEQVLALCDDDGLPMRWPGWSFVDWVDAEGWHQGIPPGADADGGSSILALHVMLAWQAAAELEQYCGEPEMAQRARRRAERLAGIIEEKFWDDDRQLLADDTSHRFFSEHAQALALLNGGFKKARHNAMLDALAGPDDSLTAASVYFQHYVFEVLHRGGRGDALMHRTEFWKRLPEQGFTTPPEKADPTRSDCHAWGSHPLFHAHASLAGVRPASPGYREVEIAPTPGPLRQLSSRTPHPRGLISVDLQLEGDGSGRAAIALPPGVAGRFVWRGRVTTLAESFSGTVEWEAER